MHQPDSGADRGRLGDIALLRVLWHIANSRTECSGQSRDQELGGYDQILFMPTL